MKKLLSAILLIVLLFSLAACKPKTAADGQGEVKIYVGDENAVVYTVELKDLTIDEGAMSVLKYLSEEKDVALAYADSGFGAYLTEFATLKPVGNQYIAVYTTCEKAYSTPPYESKKTVDGVTFTFSGVGLSSMTVEDGVCILLVVESY